MIKYFLILIAFIISSCGDSPCDDCNATGHLSSSEMIDATYKVLKAEQKDKSSFFSSQNKYEIDVIIRNTSNEGGEFEVETSAIYNNIGEEKLRQKEFIASGQSYNFRFYYKNKNKPDNFKYIVTPPKLVKTDKSICKKCNGKGKV